MDLLFQADDTTPRGAPGRGAGRAASRLRGLQQIHAGLQQRHIGPQTVQLDAVAADNPHVPG